MVSAEEWVRQAVRDAGTPRAVKDGYKQAVVALRQHGCKAADYRLSGPGDWPRYCVTRLARGWRLVMQFPAPDEVLLSLLQAHTNVSDPAAGLQERYGLPPIGDVSPWRDERDPVCCDDEAAPPCWEEGSAVVIDGLRL